MGEDLDQLVGELGAVLAAPDLPRLMRNEPGLDKKWTAGDIALRVQRERLDELAERVGLAPALLRSYADVAKAYPPEERTVRAAWTIYREVRRLPAEQRRGILKDGLTLRRARIAVGKGPMDRPRKERLPTEERAWEVIRELQDPLVREIVEREMKSSETDRRARRAARTTLDEISAQRKYVESELRKAAKAGTAERQYWETNKDLVDAEHSIYSIAKLHDLHGDAMSDERWSEVVTKLEHVANSATSVADDLLGPGGKEFLDADEVEEFALPVGSHNDDIEDAEIVSD